MSEMLLKKSSTLLQFKTSETPSRNGENPGRLNTLRHSIENSMPHLKERDLLQSGRTSEKLLKNPSTTTILESTFRTLRCLVFLMNLTILPINTSNSRKPLGPKPTSKDLRLLLITTKPRLLDKTSKLSRRLLKAKHSKKKWLNSKSLSTNTSR